MARRSKRGGARTRRVRQYRAETMADAYVPTHAAIKLAGVGVVRAQVERGLGDAAASLAASRASNPRMAFGVMQRDRRMASALAMFGFGQTFPRFADLVAAIDRQGMPDGKASQLDPDARYATVDDLYRCMVRVLASDYGFVAALAAINNNNMEGW